MKTYTGGQGYVYQYYFVGKRPAPNLTAPATEYIFDVTSDRKTTFAVSIFLPNAVVEGWAQNHGRSLTEPEQYGAVKLRLFQAFDEVENLKADGRQLSLDVATLDQVLATLGVN